MINERIAVRNALSSAAAVGRDPDGFYRSAAHFLTAQIRIFGAILSPIKGVPAEIFAEIFMLVVRGSKRKDLLRQVLHLSQVCSHWRTICHATPKLWKNFVRHVKGTTPLSSLLVDSFQCGRGTLEALQAPNPSQALLDESSTRRDMELWSFWFHRASPYAVKIELDYSNSPSPIQLLPILSHSSRIGTLVLTAYCSSISPIPDHVLANLSFPVLHDLRVSNVQGVGPNPLPVLLSHLHAPKLTNLHVELEDAVPDMQRYGSQLRNLTLAVEGGVHGSPIPSVLAALQHCTELEHLNLFSDCLEIDDFAGEIQMSKLRKATFRFDVMGNSLDILPIFSILVLPVLEELDIYLPNDYDCWDWPIWTSFMQHSGSCLRRIRFGHSESPSPDHLWGLLSNLERLEEFHISGYVEGGTEFLRHFLDPNPSSPTLPNLHSLTVVFCVQKEERTPALDSLVEGVVRSRWWTDPVPRPYRRWTHVCLARDISGWSNPWDFDEDDDKRLLSSETEERMEVIAAEGLSLDFDSQEE
ncbi:hypothetical protein AAF712_006457 [Marasmius tenuissimus]|uniref:F-box domain-containing protein n=1 Tax=Marasmius tenuissimus TaxID=585030 RepID=A0ABR2ZYK5_9AGAR